MKAFLMYRDRDFDMQSKLPPNEKALTQDLELDMLFNAMAQGDRFLFEVAKRAVLCSLNDVNTILYRQSILKDCLNNTSIIEKIFNITVESIEGIKKHSWGLSSRYPSSILHGSREVVEHVRGSAQKAQKNR